MGIYGFSSFLQIQQNETLGTDTSDHHRLHQRVDLSEVSRLFQEKQLQSQTVATQGEELPSVPLSAGVPRMLTLLVDTYAVLYYCLSLGVSRSALPQLHFLLPEYTYIREQIEWLQDAFRLHHVRLVWYIDAAGIGPLKESEHIRRSKHKIGAMSHFSDYLSGFTCKKRPDSSAIHPHCVNAAILATLRLLGCEHQICIGEADPVLTRDAIRHGIDNQKLLTTGNESDTNPVALPSWHGCVYGVLSRDADFAITHHIRYLNIEQLSFIAEIRHSLSITAESANDGERRDIHFLPSSKQVHSEDTMDELSRDMDSPAYTASTSRRFTHLPGSVPPSSIVSIHCCPLNVDVVSRLLFLPVHRLTELSFLCGNDYSKSFSNLCVSLQASKWRYSQDGSCILNPGQTVAQVVSVLSRNSDLPAECPNRHDHIRSWIEFLQHVESVFGPGVPLEQISPFKQVVQAQTGSESVTMLVMLSYSRMVYEQENEQNEMKLVESEDPALLMYQKPSIYAFLCQAVQQDLLSRSVFGWLSNGVSHGSVWWERTETLSGKNPGQGTAFRGTATPSLLPPIDSVVRPLLIANALLVNMNGLRLYERRDVELVFLDCSFTHRLPRYQQELRTLYKRAKKKSESNEPSLRVQLVRLQPMPLKIDLLNLLFQDSWEGAESNEQEATPRVASPFPLEWFHFPPLHSNKAGLSESQRQRLRLPILICRWFLMAMQSEIQAKRAQSQLHLSSHTQLQQWCATFVQCVLVMEAARSVSSSNSSLKTVNPIVHLRLRQCFSGHSSSSTAAAARTSSHARPSITTVSVFSCFQAIYVHLVPLLTSLDMQQQGHEEQSMEPRTVQSQIPILRPDELFHGEMFAVLISLQDQTANALIGTAPHILDVLSSGALSLHLESPTVIVSSEALVSHLQRCLPVAYSYTMECILGQWGFRRTFSDFVMQFAPPADNPIRQRKKVTIAALPIPPATQQLSEAELAGIDFRGGGFRSIRNLVRLPIDRVAACILRHCMSEPFVIVRGVTGSGKSSRIPALILRHWYDSATTRERNKWRIKLQARFNEEELPASLNNHPFIIVTQPRRLAVISLCKRVSEELGVAVGDECGFAISQEARRSNRTRLLFVTTGWLTTKLLHNPSFLLECSHLIMDEIHERSVEADLLTVLVRLIMQKQLKEDAARDISFPWNRVPRLILMSATFSSKLFADYFAPVFAGPSNQAAVVPEVEIDVFAYPLSIYWVDRIINMPILQNNEDTIARIYPIPVSQSALLQAAAKGTLSDTMCEFTSWLIAALSICHAKDSDANCILVFLPGILEIEKVATTLQDRYLQLYQSMKERPELEENLQPYLLVEVHILHSLVDDQLRVFAHQQPGLTYVILATNIAESSLTLPNCRYVIDFGTHKELVYNDRYQCDQLLRVKISQSSAKQRSGRTGRTCPGTVIRMYTQQVHDTEMELYDKPAILRVSLTSVILSLKSRAQAEDSLSFHDQAGRRQTLADAAFITQCELDDVQHVLSQCIQAPSLMTLDLAYAELLSSGAVEVIDLNSVRRVVAEQARQATQQRNRVSSRPQEINSKLDAHNADSDDDKSNTSGDDTTSANEKTGKQGIPSLSPDVLFKREAFRRSKVTTLGRFYASMPFGFSCSRLVAYGILFGGRCLNPCVVMACALGMLDIFVLPSPFVIKETAEFAKVVAATTVGRIHADRGRGSDPIALLDVVDSYLRFRHSMVDITTHEWARGRGVHLGRLKQLINTVAEIALRLSVLVAQPEQSTQLQQLHAFCKPIRSRNELVAEHKSQAQHCMVNEAKEDISLKPVGFRNLGDDNSGGELHLDDLHHVGLAAAVERSCSQQMIGSPQATFDANLLQLDQLTVLQLQFLLAASMWNNLLQANSKPKPLSIAPNVKTTPAKPMTPAAGSGIQGNISFLGHADQAMCVQIKKVPSALMKETLCREFREFEAIAPVVRNTYVDFTQQCVVLEFMEQNVGPSLCLGLDMFDPAATLSPWASLLALPMHVKQAVLLRMCHRGSLQITPPLPGVPLDDECKSKSPSQSSCSTLRSKPIPLECKNCLLPGDSLKFERIYDGLPIMPDESSILQLLRVYKVARDSTRVLYSDCKSQIEVAQSPMSRGSSSKARLDTTIPIFAVAASVKLLGLHHPQLRAERLTIMPCGAFQRVGAFFLAVLFGGPFSMSADGQHIVGICNKLALPSMRPNTNQGLDEMNEQELDSFAGPRTFKQRLIPIIPNLPASMASAIQALHDNTQLTHTFLTARVPRTMMLPGGASDSDCQELSVAAAFLKLVTPLVAAQLLPGGAQGLHARPSSSPLDQMCVPGRPGIGHASLPVAAACKSSAAKLKTIPVSPTPGHSFSFTSGSSTRSQRSALSVPQLKQAMSNLQVKPTRSETLPSTSRIVNPGLTSSLIASSSSTAIHEPVSSAVSESMGLNLEPPKSTVSAVAASSNSIAPSTMSTSIVSSSSNNDVRYHQTRVESALVAVLQKSPEGIRLFALGDCFIVRHSKSWNSFILPLEIRLKAFIIARVPGMFRVDELNHINGPLVTCVGASSQVPVAALQASESMKSCEDVKSSISAVARVSNFPAASAISTTIFLSSSSNDIKYHEARVESALVSILQKSAGGIRLFDLGNFFMTRHSKTWNSFILPVKSSLKAFITARVPQVFRLTDKNHINGALVTCVTAATQVPLAASSASIPVAHMDEPKLSHHRALLALCAVIVQAGNSGLRMSFIGNMFMELHGDSWANFIHPIKIGLQEFILRHVSQHFTISDVSHAQGSLVKCVKTSPSSTGSGSTVQATVPNIVPSFLSKPQRSSQAVTELWPSSSSSLPAAEVSDTTADSQLVQLVKELMPSDGSSMLCSVLAANFLAHTRQHFASRAGQKIGVWLKAHCSEFNVHGDVPRVSVVQQLPTTVISALPADARQRQQPASSSSDTQIWKKKLS